MDIECTYNVPFILLGENQSLTQRLYEYQYKFDAAGNRTQMIYFDGNTNHTTSYTYNNANQLTYRDMVSPIYTYEYDANGNMLSEEEKDSIRTFQWNIDNRLINANNNGALVQYTYDALGRRIMRVQNSTYTFYYYDGLTVVAEKQKVGSGSWDWQRIFTVGLGVIGNIFRISEKSGANWVDTYYHYDAIGNVALRTNSSGIVESIDQEAYGNVKIGSQSGYHLTTKEYDSIPELYYFCQRWYDPALRIFISKSILPEPFEKSFIICENNIVNSFDPTGLRPVIIRGDLRYTFCPLTIWRADADRNFCRDTGIMRIPHYAFSYRQVGHFGRMAVHCGYESNGVLSDGIWGAHLDSISPVEGINCDHTCNYGQIMSVRHFFDDTILGWFY